MDPAKKKRILKLLGGRSADRAQALELLGALEDDDLWRSAVATVRQTQVAGVPTVVSEDLGLLAAAPDHLPEVRELRARNRQQYFSTEVPEAAACLTHLEEVHLTAAWGGDRPNPAPSLRHLARAPVRTADLIGVDLADGAALLPWPLERLRMRNCTFSSLPVLPHLEELSGFLRDVTRLGAGLPALRRLDVEAPALEDLGAIRGAARLEELSIAKADALVDFGPLAQVAAGAHLRVVKLTGAVGLRALTALRGASALAHLEVEADLDGLGPLSGLPALAWVAVRQAPRVRDLGPLAAAHGLRCLDLRGCSAVEDLSPLVGSGALRVIALHGTATRPDTVPEVLRPLCTWAASPVLPLLEARPRPPRAA